MDNDKRKRILNAIKESAEERKKRLELDLRTRVKEPKKGKKTYVRNKNYKKDL
jgi:hypothetical protein